MPLMLYIVQLLIVFHQWNRYQKPPESGNCESDRHRYPARNHPRHIRTKYISHQCYQKRYAGAKISPRKTVGRDFIHPLFCRDIVQHRVIKHQRHIIEYFGHRKQKQKCDPLIRKSIQDTSGNANCYGRGKKDFFHPLMIRNRPAHRTKQRNHNRNHRNRHRIISRCLIRSQLPRPRPDRHRLKPDRYQRTRQHRIRRIPHIIEHPGKFFVVQIAEYPSLLHTTSSIPYIFFLNFFLFTTYYMFYYI